MTAFCDIAPCRLIEVDKHEIAFEYRYSFGSINTGKLGINLISQLHSLSHCPDILNLAK
jgi:hypothetical protein